VKEYNDFFQFDCLLEDLEGYREIYPGVKRFYLIGKNLGSGLVFQHFLFHLDHDAADGCVMHAQVIRDRL
jgi:hypothetical protein